MKELPDYALSDLVEEIRRRSLLSLIAVKLDPENTTSPDANTRILMQCRKGTCELELVGLADLAMEDVREAVREKLMGPGVDG